MTHRVIAVCLGALALAQVARADDPAPGLWELSMEARVESEPGFQPGPMSLNQCLTREDARDPSRILAPLVTSGVSDCSYSRKSYEAGTFRFALQCGGALNLKSTGEVVFSAASISGKLTTSSTIDGKSVEFKSTLTGRRLGDC